MKENMGKYQTALEEMNNASVEYVRGMPVVKAFNQTASSFKKLKDAISGYTEWVLKFSLGWQNCMPAFTTIINNIYLILIPVGILIGSSTSDFAGFAMSFIFYLLFVPAIAGVLNKIMYISESFAYNKDEVIKDVSCKIPQGSVTALVGPSGSGKSTISKLIARFWDVQKGEIKVGGKDVKTMEPECLMSYMSFVFQDVTLFNDTVMNNIRLGNPNATDEQVIAAAKAAYCDEFVREMPDAYQTILGENGSTLSGGERQRISIARALLKNAPIILLDEATASLDPENEVLVQKAIAKLVEGKTVIMIAHRLRTVVDADQILVLDEGKLVEQGTHEELMREKGLYQKLFHIQQESLGWAV